MRQKILFVDDDPDFLTILKSKFADFNGTFVFTGGEALMQIKHEKFAFVVLDMGMFLDGTTFVKLANGRLKNTKVFFLSCLPKDELVKKIEPIKDRVAGFYDKTEVDELRSVLLNELKKA